MVHDAFGWEFNNTRLLADHYAKEVGATVYLPDFYHGSAVDENDVWIKIEDGVATMGASENFDIAKFFTNNGPEVRLPEVLACARRLREQYAFVGGVGFCWFVLKSLMCLRYLLTLRPFVQGWIGRLQAGIQGTGRSS